MRRLAAFTASFALGIYLAQYLLPAEHLFPLAAGCFAAACLALLLPGLWRKRALLIGTGLVVVQYQFSRLWLRRFSHGPVEWLWKKLTWL